MDPEVILRYCNKIPREIRNAVAPLSTEKSWAIFSLLVELGPLSFTEIKKQFHTTSSGDITKFLKLLVNAGLVGQRVNSCRDLGDRAKSFYKVTNLGEALLKGLYENLLPVDPRAKEISQEYGRSPEWRRLWKSENFVKAIQLPMVPAIVTVTPEQYCHTRADAGDHVGVNLKVFFAKKSSRNDRVQEIIKEYQGGIMPNKILRGTIINSEMAQSTPIVLESRHPVMTEASVQARPSPGVKIYAS